MKSYPVAPGVHRLGDDIVNFYLVEHPDGAILIDSGLPGHHDQVADLETRAVLLTHAHPDHTGLAARLSETGAEIWIHERDAPILRDGPRSALRHAKPERRMASYLLRRPSAIGTPLRIARQGGFSAPPVARFRTFAGDQVLDEVPGRPLVVELPGHTDGSVAYVFADRGLIFTGDALVTHDGLTGHIGPTVVCRGFTHDGAGALAALDRIAELPGHLVLPGHGEPFTAGPRAAAQQARAAGLR